MKSDSGRAVVVGAGVFGVWAALLLQEQGRETVLLDSWGVAHARATSSGESRIIRAGYGDQPHYAEWAWSALREWKRREEWLKTTFFVPCGVLWLGGKGDPQLNRSVETLQELKIPCEELTPTALRRKFPTFSTEGIGRTLFEPEAGVLLARHAVRELAKGFVSLGGQFRFGRVEELIPGKSGRGLDAVRVGSEKIKADTFVFACGPWMPELFPELLGRSMEITRQEVHFFGQPAGAGDWFPDRHPAWIELGQTTMYGLPAVDGRGFKIASDDPGPDFDPTHGDRIPCPEEVKRARDYVVRRFPGLKGAPVVESRVCQYERTRNRELFIDRHPGLSNVILAGGGSGHGFKLGPTVGRLVSELAKGEEPKAHKRVPLPSV